MFIFESDLPLKKCLRQNVDKVNEFIPGGVLTSTSLGRYAALVNHPQYKQVFDNVLEVLQADDQVTPPMDLITWLSKQDIPPVTREGNRVATPQETALNFLGWLSEMGLPAEKTAMELLMILEGKLSGKSAFILKGLTTCGKSYFLTEPFKLVANVLGNITPDEKFGFMECVDKRLLIADEFRITPNNVETWKSILRGNICKVAVKCKPPAFVAKTQLLGCTNNDPSKLVFGEDGKALKQRMFFHDLQPDDLEATRAWLSDCPHPNPKYVCWLRDRLMPNEDALTAAQDDQTWIEFDLEYQLDTPRSEQTYWSPEVSQAQEIPWPTQPYDPDDNVTVVGDSDEEDKPFPVSQIRN